MKTIYYLSMSGYIFYIGQTKTPLFKRLEAHLIVHKHLKNMSRRFKRLITIHKIEKVSFKKAANREKYWIRHYKAQGCTLLNETGYKIPDTTIGHLYAILTEKEIKAIYAYGYRKLANKLGVCGEAIRVAMKKKRIKKTYYEIIFDHLSAGNQTITT